MDALFDVLHQSVEFSLKTLSCLKMHMRLLGAIILKGQVAEVTTDSYSVDTRLSLPYASLTKLFG